MPERIAVVTGGTAGIGRATAIGIGKKGFHLVLVGRDPVKGQRSAQEVAEQSSSTAEFVPADLSSLTEVRALATRLATAHPQINVLVHNFGGMYNERRVTADGHEATFATNVLTPLLLTAELLPALRAAGSARVVFVGSDSHKFAKVPLDDLESETSYLGFRAYAVAKLAQLLVARQLARHLSGTGVAVLAGNPGGAWTDQVAAMKPSMMPPPQRIMWPIIRLVQKSRTPEKAAVPIIRAASDPALEGSTGIWLGQSGEVEEPGEHARDDALGASVYDRVADLLDTAVPR